MLSEICGIGSVYAVFEAPGTVLECDFIANPESIGPADEPDSRLAVTTGMSVGDPPNVSDSINGSCESADSREAWWAF